MVLSNIEVFRTLHKEQKVFPSVSELEYANKVSAIILAHLGMTRSSSGEAVDQIDKISLNFTKSIQKIWNMKKYARNYGKVITDVFFTKNLDLPLFTAAQKNIQPPTPPRTPQKGPPPRPPPPRPPPPLPKRPRKSWDNRSKSQKFADSAKIRKLVVELGIPPQALTLASAQIEKGDFGFILKAMLENPNLAKKYREKAEEPGIYFEFNMIFLVRT